MVDLVNRDPNNINPHLQCQFEDVLAEPDGTHSIDCVWTLSSICFNCWKGCCYKIMTLLCGCCIAAEFGCRFALLSFIHIWYFTPMLKIFQINCGLCKNIYTQCINCYIEPLCIAIGSIFHHFKK
ncbi:caveolin-3-like [Dreissena polymorpha]|uniref:caveolin-3-like n=1 Tax=Dreissena polymorpha TaxID=45954 RepID=UPI002264652B|nr:caveolin-3-like [Dreissena polymorpha]